MRRHSVVPLPDNSHAPGEAGQNSHSSPQASDLKNETFRAIQPTFHTARLYFENSMRTFLTEPVPDSKFKTEHASDAACFLTFKILHSPYEERRAR